MKSLKPETQQVYRFIQHFIDDRGFPPSQREIAEGCYMARSSVQRHLDVLEARGFIERELGMARSLSLTERIPQLDELETSDVKNSELKAAERVDVVGELRSNRDSR